MAKLQLKANPTFKAKVAIPVAGAESVEVEMTFKHRTRTELEKFTADRAGKTDAETFLDIVEGWELEDPYNKASVELLLENHMGAGLAAYQKYVDELYKHKSGN